MPLRAPKMYGFIFGFQRFVWCPKWTPASRSCFIEMAEPEDCRAPAIVSAAGTGGATSAGVAGTCSGFWVSIVCLRLVPPLLVIRPPSRAKRSRPGSLRPRPGRPDEKCVYLQRGAALLAPRRDLSGG